MTRLTLLGLLLVASRSFADTDVCVYGGTAGGVAAAIQAARMGKSVVLIEPSKHIGGMTSGGLGWTDSGDKRAVGGIAREFYQRVKKHYDDPKAWKFGKREAYRFYRPDEDAMWTFEPHVAERILREMLKEAKVEVVTGQIVSATAGVADRRLRGITIFADGKPSHHRAAVFIDAT